MRPPCCITFFPDTISGSYSPQETGQSWKPLGFLRHFLQGSHIPCFQAGKWMLQLEEKRRCSWPGRASATLPSSRGIWGARSQISHDPESPVQPAWGNALGPAQPDPAVGVLLGCAVP